MLAARPVGRGAASRKYDLLSALGAHGLAGGPTDQRSALRLMTLLTARYNWTQDVLTVGQREIARLWSVDERTVKREMARLREKGWLRVLRQGARGRVTEYRLDLDQLLGATRASWDLIGPDFSARMAGGAEAPNVVPFPGRTDEPPPVGDTEWSRAQVLLHAEHLPLFAAWIAPLARTGRAGDTLCLRAPSRFHASYVQTHHLAVLLGACRRVDPSVTDLRIDG